MVSYDIYFQSIFYIVYIGVVFIIYYATFACFVFSPTENFNTCVEKKYRLNISFFKITHIFKELSLIRIQRSYFEIV